MNSYSSSADHTSRLDRSPRVSTNVLFPLLSLLWKTVSAHTAELFVSIMCDGGSHNQRHYHRLKTSHPPCNGIGKVKLIADIESGDWSLALLGDRTPKTQHHHV